MQKPDYSEIRCPHCGAAEIKLESLFGNSVSEMLFRCQKCMSFFNWMKWQGILPTNNCDDQKDEKMSSGD